MNPTLEVGVDPSPDKLFLPSHFVKCFKKTGHIEELSENTGEFVFQNWWEILLFQAEGLLFMEMMPDNL